MLKIGVLAIQGGFSEHVNALNHAAKELNIQLEIKEIISATDITSDISGIILPGGESTVASRILTKDGFGDKLKDYVAGKISKKPPIVFGTCGGLILLSKEIENQKIGGQYRIGTLDITVSRNYFGRQIDSFEATVKLNKKRFLHQAECHGVFIRAPAVVSYNKNDVEVLGTVVVEDKSDQPIIVAVQQKNIIAASFHPELTDDLTWHIHFIKTALSLVEK